LVVDDGQLPIGCHVWLFGMHLEFAMYRPQYMKLKPGDGPPVPRPDEIRYIVEKEQGPSPVLARIHFRWKHKERHQIVLLHLDEN
jgi:hypothetical protein